MTEIKCVSPSNLLIQFAEVLTLSTLVSPARSHFVDNSSNFNFITYHTLRKIHENNQSRGLKWPKVSKKGEEFT